MLHAEVKSAKTTQPDIVFARHFRVAWHCFTL